MVKDQAKGTNPALIDDEAHTLIVNVSTSRKLAKKWSPEEYSYKYLISEAIKKIYGEK